MKEVGSERVCFRGGGAQAFKKFSEIHFVLPNFSDSTGVCLTIIGFVTAW